MSAFDLTDPSQWNLVVRADLSRGTGASIPDRSFTCTSQNLVIGVFIADVRPTWNYAGRLIQYVSALPSSTAVNYSALTRVGKFPLALKSYQGLVLADANPRPFVCTVQFPKWFEACQLEVWQRVN